MATKTKSKSKRTNNRAIMAVIVVVAALALVLFGYLFLKSTTNLFNNEQARAETEALSYTPEQVAKADAEAAESVSTLFPGVNNAGTTACRYASNGSWYVRLDGSRSNLLMPRISIYKVTGNGGSYLGRYVYNGPAAFRYGSATTGYIKFRLYIRDGNVFWAEDFRKFKSLAIC